MLRFVIDFEMNAGHEMTLGREPGIQRSELVELELNMLQAAQLSALLRVDWVNIDGSVTFRYSLSGCKLLLHRLQQNAITMEQYYGLLLSTVDALTECGDYMLRPEGCLLDEGFIYVGERLHELRFVYVPIDHKGHHGYDNGDLLSLAVKWLSYVEKVDGEGLRSILQMFSDSKWPLEKLRALLLELIGKSIPGGALQSKKSTDDISIGAMSTDINSAGINSTAAKSIGLQPTNAKPPHAGPQTLTSVRGDARLEKLEIRQAIQHNDQLSASKASAWDESSQTLGKERSYLEPEEMEDERQGKRGKWLAMAAFAIGTALIWRFIYMTEPSSRNLYLSLGLTLAVLALVLFVMKRGQRIFLEKQEEDMEADWSSFDPDTGYLPPVNRRFRALEQPERHEQPQRPGRHEYLDVNKARTEEGTTTSIGDYSLPARPVQNEPTVLLSRSGEEAGGAAAGSEGWKAILRRKWKGAEEDIDLTADIFRIGRSGEGANYTENADGVSRIHLEIGRSGEEHHVKDLGSRNGSILNGELMVPYKVYKLDKGDVIHLGGEKGPEYCLV